MFDYIVPIWYYIIYYDIIHYLSISHDNNVIPLPYIHLYHEIMHPGAEVFHWFGGQFEIQCVVRVLCVLCVVVRQCIVWAVLLTYCVYTQIMMMYVCSYSRLVCVYDTMYLFQFISRYQIANSANWLLGLILGLQEHPVFVGPFIYSPRYYSTNLTLKFSC